jgi:formylglycine-generating enzyme
MRLGLLVVSPALGLALVAACDAFVPSETIRSVETDAETTIPDAAIVDATTASLDADAGVGSCPSGMVYVDLANDSFCISAYEVSRAEYLEFAKSVPLDAGGIPADDSRCSWNTSVASFDRLPGSDDKPVIDVDFCDALAYCKSRGGRLCGKRPSADTPMDHKQSEWYAACSDDGRVTYPYGNEFDASACAVLSPQRDASDPSTTIASGTPSTCQGGVPGLFNMLGNVMEWVDYTLTDSADGNSQDSVRFVGGSYRQTDKPCLTTFGGPRSFRGGDLGIRCCADRKKP